MGQNPGPTWSVAGNSEHRNKVRSANYNAGLGLSLPTHFVSLEPATPFDNLI